MSGHKSEYTYCMSPNYFNLTKVNCPEKKSLFTNTVDTLQTLKTMIHAVINFVSS